MTLTAASDGVSRTTTENGKPMPEVTRTPFSYRTDAAVPAFDDSHPLFVFDGICVLCSGGAGFVMRHDRDARVRFTPMREPLGQALYAHYGVVPDESYLLVADGRAYTASRGYVELARILGGPWQIMRLLAVLPEFIRDAAYALVARNRYRWFGTAEHCALLTPEQRARLV